MSSPIEEGTKTSSAFSSKDINILSETIYIKIDKEFKTAKFIVEYTIESDIIGRQIPLLFYAQDYKDSFFVWADSQKVNIQTIPEKYKNIGTSPFRAFSNAFHDNSETITIYWYKNLGYNYPFSDVKYFETDLVKGIHKIRVEYTANVWTDVSGWIKEYSFRYSLTPAKFWKSFGSLTIDVEQEGNVKQFITNLGQSKEEKIQTKNSWSFNKLPDEYFELTYIPTTNKLAKAFIFIQPLGFSIAFGVVFFILNLFIISWYRRKFQNKKFSVAVILGSIIIPFLILLSYMYSYDMIDNLIGDEAGRHHGYVFLVIILYPILLPIYWTIMWLIDRRQKQKLLTI